MPIRKPTKLKPCAVCGELFLPEKPSSKICKKTHYSDCPICGCKMIWNTTRKPEPCSATCRKESTRLMYIRKYGVDHPMKSKEVQEHHKKAMMAKYGVEHALQSDEIKQKASDSIREKLGVAWALSNDEVRKKSKQTMLIRYGAETTLESKVLRDKVNSTMLDKYGNNVPTRVQSIRDKIKSTNLERYNVENPMMDPDIAKRSRNSRYTNISQITDTIKSVLMEKYGVDNPSKIPEVKKKISEKLRESYPTWKDKMIETNLERYGVPYFCMTDECKELQGSIISKTNRKFGNMLSEFKIPYRLEFRIENNSYDIHLPDSNILIEIDPSYTHNVASNHWGAVKDKYYHRDKTDLAEKNGYRCIHVWDWDDWGKVVDLVRPIERRIYARNCDIYRINKDVGDKFLNLYHLQGTCRGQLLYLGLVYEGELVEIMTFGKSRYDKSYYVALMRLCTKSGVKVVGGASRLFSYATNEYGLSSIISYCDRSKFTGDVYEKMGMKFKRITPPQEVWSKSTQHITANLLRARGYDQLFGTKYDKGASNEELMLKNGWLPVYDCGQRVYVFE